MKQTIAAVLILLAWIGSARAWSEDGHRIVCAIAWKELAPETRALVEDLLKEDSASGFAEVCVWADAIRSDPAHDWAKPHHYIAPLRQRAGRRGRHQPCAGLSFCEELRDRRYRHAHRHPSR